MKDENDTPENEQKPELDGDDLALVNELEDGTKTEVELWDEIEQEEAAAADDTDPDLSGTEDAAAAATAAEDDTTAEQPADKTPAEQEQPAAEAAGTQGNDDADDIWGSATEEQRAAFEAAQAKIDKLDQSGRSARGRISSLQRELNSLIATQSAPPADETAAGDDEGASAADILQSETWKSLANEYPEVAGPLEAVLGKLSSAVESQGNALAAIGNQGKLDALDEQTALLEEQHPDWEDVVAEDGFAEWVFQQPQHIQDAATRNADGIVDAAQAADVVSRFKAARSETQGSADANNGNGNGTEQEPNPDESGKGSESTLTDKRTRQVEAASSTRSNGPSGAAGIPEDGDEKQIWDAFEREEEQRRRRA